MYQLHLRDVLVNSNEAYHKVTAIIVVGPPNRGVDLNLVAVLWTCLDNSVSNMIRPRIANVHVKGRVPGHSITQKALDAEQS